MNTFILIIVNILFYLFGKDTYKKLKSYPDLEIMLPNVAATFKRLLEVTTDDESIVDSREEYITSYKWFKGNIFNILIYKYVILNENFKNNAINNEDFRLLPFEFDESWLSSFIIKKFDIQSLFTGKKDFDFNKYFSNLDNAKVLTANQWNAFWEEILASSFKEKTLENLSCQYLLLSQIPGVKNTCRIYVGDKERLDKVKELEKDKTLTKEQLEEKIDETLHETIPCFLDFRNETELPAEFMLIRSPIKGHSLSNISPSMIELTDEHVKQIYDIHSYLFSDI